MRCVRSALYVLAHLIVAMSLTLLTLSITNHFNSAMAFVDHDMSKTLMAVLSLSVLLESVFFIPKFVGDRHLLAGLPTVAAALVSILLICLLLTDVSDKSLILFTKPFARVVVGISAVSSFFSAVTIICYMRRMAKKIYERACSKKWEAG